MSQMHDQGHDKEHESAHAENHEGPIKTPKQLILAVLASFLVPIVGIVLLVNYVDFGGKPGAGSDASGRYVPYFNRGSGTIAVEPLVDYDKPGAGDYYQLPVKTGKPVLMEPYVYPVNGKDVLMTTLSLPTRATLTPVLPVMATLPLITLPSRLVCCTHVFIVGVPTVLVQPSRSVVKGSGPGAGKRNTVSVMSKPLCAVC